MRFPTGLLLYLCSAALGLGCVWTFYQTMNRQPEVTQQQMVEQTKTLINKGRSQTPEDRLDDYSKASLSWWQSFKEANFIGVLPPEPEVEKPPEEPAPPPVEKTPIEEILDVVCIVYSPPDDSRCVVRYKPTANVTPPPDVVGTGRAGAAAAPVRGPADVTRPPATPGAKPPHAPAPTPMPAFGGDDGGWIQIVEEGGALWPQYEHIKLARVDPSGLSVYFTRTGTAEGEAPAEEKVFRNELGLDKEVLAALEQGGVATTGPRPVTSQPTEGSPDASDWIEVEETRAVSPNVWHVSRKDNDFIRDNAQTVFNEDLGLRNYQSRGGAVSGLQITKVSPRIQQFGIQTGDVLLEVNGVPVKSRAQAMQVGKEQYQKGVREFRAKFMTRWGRVEERVYHAPEK